MTEQTQFTLSVNYRRDQQLIHLGFAFGVVHPEV